MKKGLIFILMTVCSLGFAKEAKMLSDSELDYANLASTIQKVGKPYLEGNRVIFTFNSDVRHVGIAFDFENFRKIHSFKKKTHIDMEYNPTDSIYFYILDLPENIMAFDYRLVIDGLWTLDPLNENSVYNAETGLMLSHFDAARFIPEATKVLSTKVQGSNYVRFVYRGETGKSIRLGGNFTNWDSWIYTMEETTPGLYECTLPLSKGTYEYAYYSGMNSFVDNTNPKKCYTYDGRVASLIQVE